MANSRRAFFKAFLPKVEVQKPTPVDDCPLALGQLVDFPVHSVTEINLKTRDFVVESLPEGLRLCDPRTNENFKLSLNSGGLVQAHLGVSWPPSAVLSIFTGEIYHV